MEANRTRDDEVADAIRAKLDVLDELMTQAEEDGQKGAFVALTYHYESLVDVLFMFNHSKVGE